MYSRSTRSPYQQEKFSISDTNSSDSSGSSQNIYQLTNTEYSILDARIPNRPHRVNCSCEECHLTFAVPYSFDQPQKPPIQPRMAYNNRRSRPLQHSSPFTVNPESHSLYNSEHRAPFISNSFNHIRNNSPKSVASVIAAPNRHGVLYFGGVIRRDSLVGACAWWVADETNRIVTYGSIHVQQSYPCLIGVEYEGLLNGLKAAFHNNFNILTIVSCSTFILAHLSPYCNEYYHLATLFNTIAVEAKETKKAIKNYLSKLHNYDTKEINLEHNKYVYELAEKAINKYDRKQYLAMTNLFNAAQV